MAAKTHGKRPSASQQDTSKKRKLAHATTAAKGSSQKFKIKGKDHAFDRPVIPVPRTEDDEDSELEVSDLDMVQEYGPSLGFLSTLNEKDISRSKKEQGRLHQLNKPVRKAPVDDDLPSVDSHSEIEDGWDSDVASELEDSHFSKDDEGPVADSSRVRSREAADDSGSDSDAEMEYEAIPRRRRASWSESEDGKTIERLPIKLGDGRIQKSTGGRVIVQRESSEEEEEEEANIPDDSFPATRVEDVATGARFGRPAVVDVVTHKSRKMKIQGAKEQIAGICQEIVSDPENNLGLLRRLHTFSLPEISTPSRPEPVPNDPVIRKLALLSQLAAFKDIIPGYRVRPLTDKEKAEKVSQMVARTRDWEQGLVGVYQAYLKSLEHELKAREGLEDVALRSMCTLLTEVTHFNFRVNLMGAIIARLSKKSWDETSDLCLNTLISVFRADETGIPSLEIVRLLNRMVKERRYNVHPDVLSCLLHLRLKTELGVRASEAKVEKEELRARGRKGKDKSKPHLSKKAKKAQKERKEIEKEMKEAEAEVDKEERSANQTETLKLLFVLYFRILKNPVPTPLLPAALQGISRFAHLVSIDFFKDLMRVLKELVTREGLVHDDDNSALTTVTNASSHVRLQLSCIVTAFELLSGQGEALNVDLSDFIALLYALILPLSLVPDVDQAPSTASRGPRAAKSQATDALLFRALHLALSPRSFSAGASPPWRAAAFAKRLLTAALHWPATVALRALGFVEGLVGRDAKLEALLATEDRTVDGVYKPETDDPQLSNPFASSAYELCLLQTSHPDSGVRAAAVRLMQLPLAPKS